VRRLNTRPQERASVSERPRWRSRIKASDQRCRRTAEGGCDAVDLTILKLALSSTQQVRESRFVATLCDERVIPLKELKRQCRTLWSGRSIIFNMSW